nr:hypothetical protein [Vibrio furnissii]
MKAVCGRLVFAAFAP